MGIILDLVVLGIILLNVFICYQKGLVKLAVGLVAVLVSIILALLLYKPVSNIIIEKTEIDNKIENAIIENFTAQQDDEQVEEDSGFMKYIEQYVDDTVNKTKNEIVTEAAGTIAVKVINIGVIILIFVVARLILILLTFITDLITELPIIKQFNDVGGVLYGIVKALLIIYVIISHIFLTKIFQLEPLMHFIIKCKRIYITIINNLYNNKFHNNNYSKRSCNNKCNNKP